MMTDMLAIQNLAIGYVNSRRTLRIVAERLNTSLGAGEFACLIGPNGAGKSTLLRTIAGMQSPLAGSVLLQGCDIHRLSPSERARHLAVVLTDRMDVGALSASALVALGAIPIRVGWAI